MFICIYLSHFNNIDNISRIEKIIIIHADMIPTILATDEVFFLGKRKFLSYLHLCHDPIFDRCCTHFSSDYMSGPF